MNNEEFIKLLGYAPKEGTKNLYEKNYSGLIIEIDLEENKVIYPTNNAFEVIRKTSSNLNNQENLSVLECLDCLLEKGYKANDITIERSFTSGTSEVYLDISVQYPKNYFIKELQSKTYMMIEVKQFSEYEKTIKESYQIKNNKPKSQLLSYFNSDKHADFLIYYTNKINSNSIERLYSFIKTEDLKEEKSALDIYNKWNKTYHVNKGIFEKNIPTYENKIQDLMKSDLKDISSNEDSGVIFHQFLTILRRYSISDKSNAFNKIFNMFICKIKDEDSHQNSEDILDFQWLHNDSYVSLLNRLNTLYKNGIDEYLSIQVCDTTEDEFDAILKNLNVSNMSTIKEVYNQLRLYKNNDFAFIEVFNKETFEMNAKIVKEIVELLQGYKLKYNQKQQFMGDFFEHLLNTGLKQENGQFFTPIPVARFIVNSIPIEKTIHNKINKNPRRLKSDEYSILPYCIDYAAGSGHFLTEIMDAINSIIINIQANGVYDSNPNIRKTLKSYSDPEKLYNWAPEYIYGVEKDYRLAKTAKVCCFLNGDGDANMIYGDGLDDFKTSKHYVGKLKNKIKNKEDKETKDNGEFDIVIANPPYSVSNFKSNINLQEGEQRFDLYKYLGEDSDDIECLFIERTKQLLKNNGFAGIVLPISILNNNSTTYNKTRELIFKNFNVKAIVDMTSKGNVFAKTGTNAVILFLEKKEDNFNLINKLIEQLFLIKQDMAINGITNLPSLYSSNIHEIELSEYFKYIDGFHFKQIGKKTIKEVFDTYEKIQAYKEKIISNSKKKTNKKFLNFKLEDYLKKYFIIDNDIFFDYFNKYYDTLKAKSRKGVPFNISEYLQIIKNKEIERMTYYAISLPQKTLIVKVPNEKNELETFLGYSFSERSGEEGIKMLKDNDIFQSLLYDETDLENEEKLNFYIKKHLANEKIDIISEKVTSYINIVNLSEVIDFTRGNWIKEISTSIKINKICSDSKYEYKKLSSIASITSGVVYNKEEQTNIETNNKILTADNILLDCTLSIKKTIFLKNDVFISNEKKLKANDTFMCFSSGSKAHIGKVTFIDKDLDYYSSGFMGIIRTLDEKNLDSKYLYLMLKQGFKDNIFSKLSNGSNINNLASILGEVKIPLPPLKIQKELVKKIEENEMEIKKLLLDYEKVNNKIEQQYKYINEHGVNYKISECCEPITIGATPLRKEQKYYLGGKYTWIAIGDISKNKGKLISNSKEKISDFAIKNTGISEKIVKKGSVLFSFKLSIGKVAIADIDLYTNEAIACLNSKNNIMDNQYLYYTLKNPFNNFLPQNAKAFGKSLNKDTIKDLEVKVIQNQINQNNIVKNLDKLYEEINILDEKIKYFNDFSLIIKEFL